MNSSSFLTVFVLMCLFAAGKFVYSIIRDTKSDKNKLEEERKRTGNKFHGSRDEKIEYFIDKNPSKGISFGRKISWLAIKANDHEAVVQAINKAGKESYKTNVENGVHAAYASHMFVLPSIEGWTLVMDMGLPFHNATLLESIKELSLMFGEVQAYGSHRVSDFSAWVKCVDGKIVRAFSYADSELYADIGPQTKLEEEFYQNAIDNETDKESLEWIKGEGKYSCLSDEENVLAMAEHWSVNPDKLDQHDDSIGLGTIIKC